MPTKPLRRRNPAQEARVLARLRKFCLALPEATETHAFGHPNFRAGKKTFAAYEDCRGRPSIAFKLPREEAAAMLLSDDRFFPTPYGRGLWVSLWADRPLNWPEIEDLLTKGYRGVALKRMLAALEKHPPGKTSTG
ncbi:MAG: MmcQ/YjbR family DNA-binding protein [Gammaproteobacteria bacterium]|nr:MmcQ/YjbR family DNA-binding protein [Gammaproteobacteria bacterium]